MTDEPTFTLVEAAAELARRECAMHGHDWNILSVMGRGPVELLCDRCGESRPVAAKAVCSDPAHSHLTDFEDRCVHCDAPYKASHDR